MDYCCELSATFMCVLLKKKAVRKGIEICKIIKYFIIRSIISNGAELCTINVEPQMLPQHKTSKLLYFLHALFNKPFMYFNMYCTSSVSQPEEQHLVANCNFLWSHYLHNPYSRVLFFKCTVMNVVFLALRRQRLWPKSDDIDDENGSREEK